MWKKNFKVMLVLLGLAAGQAVADVPTDEARVRAYERILDARREGLSIVTSALEIVVNGDDLCLVNFTLVSGNRVREDERDCYTVTGAYDARKDGLQRSRLMGVRQYLLSYPNCGRWSKLETDVFNREDIFPELQHLARKDSLVREYLLRVVVGHQVMFYNPSTKGLSVCGR